MEWCPKLNPVKSKTEKKTNKGKHNIKDSDQWDTSTDT